MFGMVTPPSGFLKCNGQAVSRTTYSALFAAIGTTYGSGDGSTTFNLPEFRGEFVRALDDGRGVDTGRLIGTTQTGDMASHTHTGSTNTTGAHTHTYTNPGVSTATAQVSGPINYGAYTTNTSSSGDHSHTVSIGSTGGTETRPRNVSVLMCIFTGV